MAASPPADAPLHPVPPPVLAAAAEPFRIEELRACLTRPQRTLDVVLAERDRLVATVRTGQSLPTLLAVLLICSTAFAVPFATVDGVSRLGRVAMLFLGSVLICFPSLQVFGGYLGLRVSPLQNLALALVIPAAAALFTLGFWPIYWFLDATMPADAKLNGVSVRVVLLLLSMLLAISHCNRCLFADPMLRALRASWPLWLGWQVLLLFITYRMANTLGLFG